MDHEPLIKFSADILDDPNVGMVRLLGDHPMSEFIRCAATAARSHASSEVRLELAEQLTAVGAGPILTEDLTGEYPPDDPVREAGAVALSVLDEDLVSAILHAGQAAFAFVVVVLPGESLREEHRGNKRAGQEFPFTAARSASLAVRAHHLSRLQQALDEPNHPVPSEEGESLDEYSSRINNEIDRLLQLALG